MPAVPGKLKLAVRGFPFKGSCPCGRFGWVEAKQPLDTLMPMVCRDCGQRVVQTVPPPEN